MRAAFRAAVRRGVSARHASVPAVLSAPAAETTLTELREQTTKQRDALAKAADAKAFFWAELPKHKSLESLVGLYEEMMLPVHTLRNTIYESWVEQCGKFSQIKNTKDATAAQKAEWEKEHAALGELIKELQAKQAAYVEKTFDTEIYNTVLATLAKHLQLPGVHNTALRIFHDMTDNQVTFNQETQNLLKYVCFGDSEYENSDLLFSCIEYPERGAHTFVKDESLEQISERMLGTISERQALPMSPNDQTQRDAGFLLRPKEQEAKEAISE